MKKPIIPAGPAIALDLGTKLGYCVFDGCVVLAVGTINLPQASKSGSRMGRRYNAIKQLIRQWPDIKTVYYECTDWSRPAFSGEGMWARRRRERINLTVQRALGRIEGLIESAGFELGLVVLPVTVKQAKKTLTGKANASKEEVKAAVKRIFQIENDSQDALDAISVATWSMSQNDDLWRMKAAKKE